MIVAYQVLRNKLANSKVFSIVYIHLGKPYSLACIAERISASMDKIPTRTDLEHFVTKQDLSGKILDCYSRLPFL